MTYKHSLQKIIAGTALVYSNLGCGTGISDLAPKEGTYQTTTVPYIFLPLLPREGEATLRRDDDELISYNFGYPVRFNKNGVSGSLIDNLFNLLYSTFFTCPNCSCPSEGFTDSEGIFIGDRNFIIHSEHRSCNVDMPYRGEFVIGHWVSD